MTDRWHNTPGDVDLATALWTQADGLRQRAETRFDANAALNPADTRQISAQATQQVLHELQVHQIELEMQNDELHQAHQALEASRARYFDLYDLAPVGYLTVSAGGLILEANLTAATLLGVHRSLLVTRALHAFVALQDQDAYYLMCRQLLENGQEQSCEVRIVCPDKHLLWVSVQATTAMDSGAPVLRMVLSNISARKSVEHQLSYLAHYDALTGLPNRRLKAERLQQAITWARLSGQRLAVVYIDLDGFKSINDQHGHDAGDQLLITLAHRMQQVLREGDTLARLGGDEFVAVLCTLSDADECRPLLDGLLNAASQPMPFGDETLQVSASLGVTFYPQVQELEGDQLLRQADQAMYQAKQAGKNRYQLFDAQYDQHQRDLLQAQQRIAQALKAHQFVLHYQPKVNLRTGQVFGVEALIRWQHPSRGLLLPAEFLPIIEEHPLAIEIGEWVINTALTQMALWQAQGLEMAVSVNVGALQLQQANFVERLRGLLALHPSIDPKQLELEILETSALQDVDCVSQVIEDCQLFGIGFALDDFGTGYSSLMYLKRLRVVLLKIDQSFVRDMLDDPNDLNILEGILGLSRAFRCAVIAEGVETQAHAELLLQLGCELAQGYGIARPMPASALPAWVEIWQSNIPFSNAV
jgi:diguanylate cyclase (GGDEF)-like protein/PAS domain S-box-containing protein